MSRYSTSATNLGSIQVAFGLRIGILVSCLEASASIDIALLRVLEDGHDVELWHFGGLLNVRAAKSK